MIINKKRFKKILIKRKDSRKWLPIKLNPCKQGLDRWVDRSRQSSVQ